MRIKLLALALVFALNSGADAATPDPLVQQFRDLNGKLAECYKKGDWTGAKTTFQSLIAVTEKAKGLDHPDVRESMKNYSLLLERLGDQHGLKVLELRESALRRAPDGGYSHLIDITGPDMTDEDVAFILRGLQRDMWQLTLDDTAVGDKTMKFLQGFNNMERLYLSGTKITDAGLAALGSKSQVLQLIMNRTAITDAGIAQMGSMPVLKTLSLNETKVKGESFAVLATKCPALRLLSLEKDQLTLAGWKAVGKCDQIGDLSLCESNASDEAVEALSGMKSLKTLNLYKTNVSDSCLPALLKATLRGVNLNGTHCTAETAAKLKSTAVKVNFE